MDAYTAKGTIFKEQSSCSIQNVTSKTQKLTVPSGFGLQMTLFSLSLAANILISQGPLDVDPALCAGSKSKVYRWALESVSVY